MMKLFQRYILSVSFILFAFLISVSAQDLSGYKFTKVKEIKNTSVKNQQRTGTCWSFATTSFIESELIRMGKEPLDLAEMFFVRHAYIKKAENYIRFHGNANFSQGGQAHDVMNAVRLYGVVPQEVYQGLNYGSDIHNHSELSSVLKGFLDGLLKNQVLSPVWEKAYDAILDVYLGDEVISFNYKGRAYTPSEFAISTVLDPDDYLELTSYTHAPFYSTFILEVPDNWSFDKYYNLPLDELIQVIDHALDNGYTVCWDGDVSEKGFSHSNGVAVVPDMTISMEDVPASQYAVKEKIITQELRQESFTNYSTTDDHLMHLVGTATAQNGQRFYLTKNSWGTESNNMGGKLYMSVPYARLHTIAVMVHKDALPEDIKEKLNL
ncbi:MAG: aminopeptidase [Bacteroides sp. SM23_62_1]|nr:MAG: aminopeptidase [Bacteroides sp. SM23_62_1]